MNPLPWNEEAERATLGAMIRDNRIISSIKRILKPEDFYSDRNRETCSAIYAMDDEGKPVDLTLLVAWVKGKSQKLDGDFIVGLAVEVEVPRNGFHYAKLVRNLSIRRAAIMQCMKTAEAAADPGGELAAVLDQVDKAVQDAIRRLDDSTDATMADLAARVLDEIQARQDGKPAAGAVPFGFRDLDDLTGGLGAGAFVIVAGRPSMGKSTLAFNVLHRAGQSGKRGLIQSYEMDADSIFEAILCVDAHVSLEAMRKGKLGRDLVERVVLAAGALADSNAFHIVRPKNPDVSAAIATIRDYRERKGIDFAIVDYLNLLECREARGRGFENRQSEVASISRRLKNLAADLRIPIIAVCQLNRQSEGREDRRPRLSDLRESGSIEQDADLVLLLYRDEYYNRETTAKHVCEVHVAKQRRGRTGVVRLTTLLDFCRFENYAAPPGQETPADWRDR